jgi:hypothetical protein
MLLLLSQTVLMVCCCCLLALIETRMSTPGMTGCAVCLLLLCCGLLGLTYDGQPLLRLLLMAQVSMPGGRPSASVWVLQGCLARREA